MLASSTRPTGDDGASINVTAPGELFQLPWMVFMLLS